MSIMTTDTRTPDPQIQTRLVECAIEGDERIKSRLHELNREWSHNRALELVTSVTTLLGAMIAWIWTPWGLALVALAAVFQLQNALARSSVLGACLRKLGWRSATERELERSMLKAIRGDYSVVPSLVDEEDRRAIERLEGEGGSIDGAGTAVPVDDSAVREVMEIAQRDTPVS